MPDPTQAQRLVTDIAARLRGVCAHLDDEAFATLVYGIARVRLRDEVRERRAESEALDRAVLERLAHDVGHHRAD